MGCRNTKRIFVVTNIYNIDAQIKIIRAYINSTGRDSRKIGDVLIKDALSGYNKDGSRKKRKIGQRPTKLKR